MKMVEIKYRSNIKELEKLQSRLERAEKAYEKKLAMAVKMGVENMTPDEHTEWLRTVPSNENGFITDKGAIKKNGAWFDLRYAKYEVEDIKRQIGNAEKRFEKLQEKVDAYRAEIAETANLKAKEALAQMEFEQEQKEWAKDGITLEERYAGYTPQGKRFWIYRNSGMTERSWHCYTLYIDRELVFTSGEFWRAYSLIRKA